MLNHLLKPWLKVLVLFVYILTPRFLDAAEPTHSYWVVNRYPHDPKAFTQGLVYFEGFLYEGTGLYGESSLRKVNLEDGAVLQVHKLDAGLFGEGVAILDGSIIQLTWKEGLGLVYDLADFKQVKEFHYEGEGWGLTTDGKDLIMSDGSHVLTYLDAKSYEPIKTVEVYGAEGPIRFLNELEYVQGEILANIWFDHRLCRIDPSTGQVLGWIDFSDLYRKEEVENEGADVLNGIAYDAKQDRLFVTGKLWGSIYEIRLAD